MRKPTILTTLAVVLMLVIAQGTILASPLQQTNSTPIYGLIGTIHHSPQPQYDDYLLSLNGEMYGMVGINAAIQREINRFANRQPPVQVQIWGKLYEGVNDVGGHQIVVSDILEVATGGKGGSTPTASVAVDVLNVRSGPSTAYPVIDQIRRNETYDIIGRRPWYLVSGLPGAREGWITGDLVEVGGNTDDIPIVSVPPPTQPKPKPEPTEPTVFYGWKTAYFANPDLNPPVAAYADFQRIEFNWGEGPPHPTVPADDFSIRFERDIVFPTNTYNLYAQADDGIRVWLDGQLIIDEWHGATGRTYTTRRQLSGKHTIKIEYFEAIGDASLRFWYEVTELQPNTWGVAYYDDIYLMGDPIYLDIDYPGRWKIDHHWGLGSPASVVPDDNWSGHWQGQWYFDSGNYLFTLKSDDGARLWLDGHQVIDAWSDGQGIKENTFDGIGSGWHTVEVEYFERGGLALLELEWSALGYGGERP